MSANDSGAADERQDDLRFEEVLPWIEFGCWTAILLFPFLYWVNGPAVSTDQYVTRTILIISAITGAVGLRCFRWWSAKREGASGEKAGASRAPTDSESGLKSPD